LTGTAAGESLASLIGGLVGRGGGLFGGGGGFCGGGGGGGGFLLSGDAMTMLRMFKCFVFVTPPPKSNSATTKVEAQDFEAGVKVLTDKTVPRTILVSKLDPSRRFDSAGLVI
jgi:hypothetical protein